jgi:pilus assembly protein Flp/PilA
LSYERVGSNGMGLVVKNLATRFLHDESAATSIEYGLMAAGVSVPIIAVDSGLGTKLKTTFTSIQTALK